MVEGTKWGGDVEGWAAGEPGCGWEGLFTLQVALFFRCVSILTKYFPHVSQATFFTFWRFARVFVESRCW